MRQFLAGLVLGCSIASAGALFAQGVMISPSDSPGQTIWSTPEGYGSILDFGGGISSYSLPNGQHGTIQRIPGGGKSPC